MNVRDPKTSRVRLDGGEVHLWWGRRDAAWNLDAVRGWLSDEERRRGERFRRARDAHAFLFRRAFRRSVLASYVGVAPWEICFETSECGKPSLVGAHGRVRFNASSSDEWTLVGVSADRELGVDVEKGDGRFLEQEELSLLARRVLTGAEQDCLAQLPGSERLRAFLRVWTGKEALLKALGTGLSREPSTVEVGLESNGGERALDTKLFPGRLLDLPAPSGFSASVVVAAEPGERLRFLGRELGGRTFSAR